MIRALYSAASGMTAQQMNVDNIANNLANANTTGYKSRRAQFQDLIYQNMIQPALPPASRPSFPPACNWASARARFQRNHLHPGKLHGDRQSSRLVIQGNGFFQILRPTDSSPTRATARSSSTRTATW